MSKQNQAEELHARQEEWRVYEHRRGWAALGLRELWEHRELLFFLAWRDVLVRYKQAVLGVLWAVLVPLFTMVVFTVVFNRFLGVKSPSPQIPYPVFSYAGLLPWNFFAGALAVSSGSVVANASLVTKVYFPRLVIPLSGVLAGLVDFAIAFVVLLALMAGYRIAPTWNIVFLPVFILLTIAITVGVSLWLSALNVLYRDVGYVIPFLVQIWMFVSPVIYPTSSIKSPVARALLALNPMTGVLNGFRWALLGERASLDVYTWISLIGVAVVLAGGLFFFKRMERVFADVV